MTTTDNETASTSIAFTPEEREVALEQLIKDQVAVIREAKRRQDEANKRELEAAKFLAAMRRQAKKAAEARSQLVAEFTAALEKVLETGAALKHNRDEFRSAANFCLKVQKPLGIVWPKPFGIDPAERDLMRQVSTLLSDIGGRA